VTRWRRGTGRGKAPRGSEEWGGGPAQLWAATAGLQGPESGGHRRAAAPACHTDRGGQGLTNGPRYSAPVKTVLNRIQIQTV
jgi:hypothetical protein